MGVEYLFFIGYQLVGLSSVGKIGVWHAMTRNWQTQDVLPVASFDTAGSFLLLGCTNGSIYYIGGCWCDGCWGAPTVPSTTLMGAGVH